MKRVVKPRAVKASAPGPKQYRVKAGWHPSFSLLEIYTQNQKLGELHGVDQPVKALYLWNGRISCTYWSIFWQSSLPHFPREPPVTLNLWLFPDAHVRGQFHITKWEVLVGPVEKTQGLQVSHVASIAKNPSIQPVSSVQDQPSSFGPPRHSP